MGASTQLAAISENLDALIASNVQVSVAPIVDDVKGLLKGAITDIYCLVDTSDNPYLRRQISRLEVTHIIGTLLCLPFDILLVG